MISTSTEEEEDNDDLLLGVKGTPMIDPFVTWWIALTRRFNPMQRVKGGCCVVGGYGDDEEEDDDDDGDVIDVMFDIDESGDDVCIFIVGDLIGIEMYEVNSELVMFTEACQAAYEASKPKVQRTPVERDRYGAHDRLVMACFSEHPQYDEATFRERFRMSRRLFTKIVREVNDASHFFQQRDDCTGQRGISSLMKCTSAIRQMAYGSVPDSLDEYLQMGATTARKSLQNFCKVVMNLYGEEFLRKPTYTDMEKLYAYHDEKHGFLGYPFILLEAIASNDLWIWHAFFGVSGMNNDVNVLRQSPIFNDLKSGRAPDVPFVANNVLYKRGYYLTDGIYPQWSVLIKSIKNPGTHDHKRILYKTKHEAARKDVERAFGVLK
ncbi:ALP1-like protein [Tanacetum coccineum]